MASDLQVYLDTVNHRPAARVLYHCGFVQDLHDRVQKHVGEGKSIAEHYGYFSPVGVGPRRPDGLAMPDYGRYWHGQELPAGTTFDGNGVAMVPSGFYHFWGYVSPLRNAGSLEEIERYPLDDVGGYDFSQMAQTVVDAHAAGKVATGWVGHMYEVAWQVRGYEPFLMDMIERPAWAEAMLEKFMRRNLVLATAMARAGVDCLHCGDDVANQKSMMFAPAMWRGMMLARWAKVWDAARRIKGDIQIHYHSDGNIFEVVGELIEAGVTILNPLQPECLDVDEAHRRWGQRVAFDGTLGTQSTMPFGTPGEVKARVREVIEKYGRRGGLIVSPTHVLEPEVPIANIEAMAEACREYGTLEG